MDVEVIEVYGVCWIYLAQDTDQWWSLVYMWKCVKFLTNVRTYKLCKSYFGP